MQAATTPAALALGVAEGVACAVLASLGFASGLLVSAALVSVALGEALLVAVSLGEAEGLAEAEALAEAVSEGRALKLWKGAPVAVAVEATVVLLVINHADDARHARNQQENDGEQGNNRHDATAAVNFGRQNGTVFRHTLRIPGFNLRFTMNPFHAVLGIYSL